VTTASTTGTSGTSGNTGTHGTTGTTTTTGPVATSSTGGRSSTSTSTNGTIGTVGTVGGTHGTSTNGTTIGTVGTIGSVGSIGTNNSNTTGTTGNIGSIGSIGTTATNGAYDTCATCDASGGCASDTEGCIAESANATSGYCSPACSSDSDCQGGDVCTAFDDGQGGTFNGCYPSSGSCQGTTGTIGSTGTTSSSSGAICDSCSSDSDCQSGFCNVYDANAGFCDTSNLCSFDSSECGSLGCSDVVSDDCACPQLGGGGTTGSTGTSGFYDTCSPCDASGGCASDTEGCIAESANATSGYCSPACSSDSDCQGGDVCTAFDDGQGGTFNGCYPSSGTCQ
jgi:hypothetical protein